ncbi:MAG: hypothetical protein R2836_02220 [Chitinophagales bacterium]|nr:hypothetical protein [Chitinophagales bacterium]
MKKIVIIILLIVGLNACKSTQSASTSTSEQKTVQTNQLNKSEGLDMSKKVDLQPNNSIKAKEPMKVNTMDKSQIRKISIEKTNKVGNN